MTAQNVINYALTLLNVLASGETPSTEESADGLTALNGLLSSWSTEELSVFAATTQTFSLSTAATYTYGTGGTFNAPRPTKILSGGILLTISGGVEMRVTDLKIATIEEYASVKEKAQSAQSPLIAYVDNAYPLCSVSFWPKPTNVGTPRVELHVYQPFTAFIAGDTFDMPPGYFRAVAYALASELAPMFGRQLAPEVAAIAQASKGMIMMLNKSDKAAVKESLIPQAA
jgi:hypothetical protein